MGKSSRVERTNDSSTVSKLSMLRAGYMDGGITELEMFVKWERRTALINRGYFIRVAAIQSLFESFLRAHDGQPIQFVNLGAGFDVLFLRQVITDSRYGMPDKEQDHIFVEVDLENVIRSKAAAIRPLFNFATEKSKEQECDVEKLCSNYFLVICNMMDAKALKRKLVNGCQLDPTRPTLFIAECVLNYLPADAADTLLSVLSTAFPISSFVVYEQIEPWDKFGRTMVKHFQSIHSPLLCIETYPNVASQVARYRNLAFPAVECYPIGHLYDAYLSPEQRATISRLEMFDEYEMWHAKCSHYVITLASTMEELQERLLHYFQVPRFDPQLNDYVISSSLKVIQHSIALSSGRFQRYGHKSVLVERVVNGQRLVYVFSCGGWGIDERGQQRRLRAPCLLDLDTYSGSKCELSCPTAAANDSHKNGSNMTPNWSGLLERCYHTLTPLGNGRTVFVFGGRRSPKEATLSPLLIHFNPELDSVELTSLPCNGDHPVGRWRHAAVLVNDTVIICGGLTKSDQHPLSDCWVFHVGDQTWTRLPDLPIPVHSHCICYDDKHKVLVVICGLEKDDRVCTAVQYYSLERNCWKTAAAPIGFHIYGSECVLVESALIAVGGVSPKYGEFHHVAVMRYSLKEDQMTVESSRIYGLPDSSDFMLMNHTALFDEERKRIFVFGGGGNCFSFGTCFNESVMEIDISTI